MALTINTLHWKDLDTWKMPVLEMLKDPINEEVVEYVKKFPPKFIASDDFSWLERIIKDVRNKDVSIIDTFAERLQNHYKALRAFHACRPTDISSYDNNGLVPLDYDLFDEMARNHFLTEEFPEVTEMILNSAIKEVRRSPNREGHISFELNEKSLIERNSHYLLYGSEYLIGIAAALTRNLKMRDYKQTLKKIGIPTIFVCDVPITIIPIDTIYDLCGSILKILFSSILDEKYKHPQTFFGFSIDQSLSPDNIVGHYHPKMIWDRSIHRMIAI
jgi:hypothetical protein